MDRTDQHHDTKDRILAIGQELIVGKGFSAIGLNEILSRAEVPKGSFYHYFQSKEGFGVAMLERYFSNYLHSASTVLDDSSLPLRARLLRYFGNWRQMAKDSQCHNMCLAVKLAAEVSDLSEPMRQALSAGMDGITAQIASAISAAQAQGELANQDKPDAIAETLYGIWVGASLLTKVMRHTGAMDLAYQQTEQILAKAG